MLVVGFLALSGCYHHHRSAGSAPALPEWRPPLPKAQSGVYAVRGPNGIVGVEAFTVTSSSAEWAVRSRRQTPGGEEGFELRIDPTTAEPIGFECWRAVQGLRRVVRGERKGAWFEVRAAGMGGASARRVSYAPGTMIDAPSPAMKGAFLALLALRMARGRPIPVRTIRIDGPHLRPRVVLSTFEGRGEDGAQLLVRLSRPGEPSIGLWVRADGWPVRMRALDTNRQVGWSWNLTTPSPATGRVSGRSSTLGR